VITFCYDLSVSPATYDFTGFLVSAAAESDFAVHLIPGPWGGFRDDQFAPYSVAERILMRDRIVVPMTGLAPNCHGCVVQADRRKPDGDVRHYGVRHYGANVMVEMMRRGVFPLRSTKKTGRGKPYATITLREASYWPTRNSDVAEWLKVAEWIERKGIEPVFVRDSAEAETPLPFATEPLAAIDLLERAAIYAGAELNLFVNNGPAWMAVFMGVPLLICKLVVPDIPAASERWFATCGLPVGSQMPNARPRQRLLWADDGADAIISEIETCGLL